MSVRDRQPAQGGGASRHCCVPGATLPAAFARFGRRLPDSIDGQVRALSFFGGITKAIVCDKAGVHKARWFGPTVAEPGEAVAARYPATEQSASPLRASVPGRPAPNPARSDSAADGPFGETDPVPAPHHRQSPQTGASTVRKRKRTAPSPTRRSGSWSGRRRPCGEQVATEIVGTEPVLVRHRFPGHLRRSCTRRKGDPLCENRYEQEHPGQKQPVAPIGICRTN